MFTTNAPGNGTDAQAKQGFLDDVTSHGSVFVTRTVKKLLLPEHVHAVADYLSNQVQAFHQSEQTGITSMQLHLDRVTKADFLTFWGKWVDECKKKDSAGAVSLVSPYEV